MIEIQVSGLMVGLIFGMIIGGGVAFFAVWRVEVSMPDRFSAGWNAGTEYGKMLTKRDEEDNHGVSSNCGIAGDPGRDLPGS